MTKTFTYTFTKITKTEDGSWKNEEITLTKKVTDKMEERNSWKAVYAANYFTNVIRTKYNMGNKCVHTKNLVEVSK